MTTAMTFRVRCNKTMQSLWVYYLLWESLPILKAHPISPAVSLNTNESLRHWDLNWFKYTVGLLGITITAFTLVGCLCCRRNRRPKGFQEFKNGSSIENKGSVPQLQGLELQIPTNINVIDQIQFEPLPVENFVSEISTSSRPKPPPASPSLFEEESENHLALQISCNELFQKNDFHVPREKLKYLREIGHGWFGKVVEGCTELKSSYLNKSNKKNGNVVVRILTEEATAKEKTWFLGEATPYFKLHHRNILSLIGSCLETDPYLLLFESCPLGDLKSFLHTNRDAQSRKALIHENMPTRIAIEIGAGLRHMHEHGLTHTDLSARNCLVASDLSIKLGDYGTGVEKYPRDYYILGDRALPIRWSAPETIECTETTIETREITPCANFWSYGILLWEIAMWGKRPYDELEDEIVIKMLLSSKSGLKSVGSQLLLQNSMDCASNLLNAIKTCLVLEPNKRFSLEKVRHVLLKDQLENSEFEQCWETLRPNIPKEQMRSASLQDLRGSIDSEQWPSLTQTSFRLGPEEPVKNVPDALSRSKLPFRDSDSETEEESWRGRVERGAYTEKVKQKSKSVADLMVLVHIEPDSDADLSLGPQMPIMDKAILGKKRLSVTGSEGDLPSAVFDDQFDLTLRKLRNPLISNNNLHTTKAVSISCNTERPKLLTLTMDQGQTPILRLALDSELDSNIKEEIFGQNCLKLLNDESESNNLNCTEQAITFLSKDINQSMFRYDGEITSPINASHLNKDLESETDTNVNNEYVTPTYFSNNFQITDLDDDSNDTCEVIKGDHHFNKRNLFNINSWNNTVNPVFEIKSEDFNINASPECMHKIDKVNEEKITPSPQSRAEYSTEDAEDVENEFYNVEDLPSLSKRNLPMDDEDDRKRMSTPDDERSSDSGFRDKESCEEEESPLPGSIPNLITSQSNTPKSTTHDSTDEEQLRILFELDTILDAEYYGAFNDSLNSDLDKSLQITNLEHRPENSGDPSNTTNEDIEVDPMQMSGGNSNYIPSSIKDHNEDEDSSTISLRSDNSYVSFGMDEEFLTAIRNELKEKLPHTQTTVVETQELRNDNEPSFISDVDSKNWKDEAEEDLFDRSSAFDISIRYNTHDTLLSPILEERESASNSESTNTKDNSQDASIISKSGSNSLSEDDVLLVDTQTNKAMLIEIMSSRSQDPEEMLNHATLDSDNPLINMQHQYRRLSFTMDNKFCGILAGNYDAPLPSPEDENYKWEQQMSTYQILPLQLESNLMSTSFTDKQEWCNDNEDEDRFSKELTSEISIENEVENEDEVENDDDDDDDEGEDGVLEEDDDNDDDDDGDSSSSSGEFIWQQYGAAHLEVHGSENLKKSKMDEVNDIADHVNEDIETEDEEEFTPSAWDATLAPHRSSLRSPDKTLKTRDQKKSVWFKKQRYHCVYEYPKETLPIENQSSTTSVWESTSYTDWEEMIDNIDRLNFQPMDYFESNNTKRNEEFYVSSSNRPFQFQSGNEKYVSQFFPGASDSGPTTVSQEATSQKSESQPSDESLQQQFSSDRQQLGELRHTRNRLKLNLLTFPSSPSNGGAGINSGSSKVAQVYVSEKHDTDVCEKDELEQCNSEIEEKKLEEDSTKAEENVCNESESTKAIDEKMSISTTVSETQEPVGHVKILPSDGLRNHDSLKSKSSCDNLDVD